MKRFALMVLFLVALAAPAMSQQVGDISIYSDALGNNCNITTGAFFQPYVIHKFGNGGGSTGSRFKVTAPAELTIAAFNTTFTPVGDIKSDLSLAYGVCITETTVIGQMIVTQAGGPPAGCTWMSVEKADNFANAIATDCSFGEYTVKVGQAILNPTGSCPCTIGTEATSWGKVKALYR